MYKQTSSPETGSNNLPSPAKVTFTVKAWYNDTEINPSQNVRHAYIELTPSPQSQSRGDASYQQAFRRFNPNLPAPVPPIEGMNSLDIAEDNCEADGNPECDPRLQMTVEIFYGDGITPQQQSYKPYTSLVIGKVEYVTLQVTVENQGETAYRPATEVTVEVDNDLDVPSRTLQFALEQSFGGRDRNICNQQVFEDRIGFVTNCTGSSPLQNKSLASAPETFA